MNKGFTLVELSITLVIIGMIVGGILVGRDMIRAAELRSVATQVTNYASAVNTFKDKYSELPGDMARAANFWALKTPDCLTPDTGSEHRTCSGNSNGIIEQDRDAITGASEGLLFWQHLAKAGLIAGVFTGMPGPDNELDEIIGENVPETKILKASFNIEDTPDGEDYDQQYGLHYLEFGSKHDRYDTDYPVLIPQEAWQIDEKMDDGHPVYGRVVARFWNNTCAGARDGLHSRTNFDAMYNAERETIECALIFKGMF